VSSLTISVFTPHSSGCPQCGNPQWKRCKCRNSHRCSWIRGVLPGTPRPRTRENRLALNTQIALQTRVKSFFRWAHSAGMVLRDPARQLRSITPDESGTMPLTPKQFDELLAATEKMNAGMRYNAARIGSIGTVCCWGTEFPSRATTRKLCRAIATQCTPVGLELSTCINTRSPCFYAHGFAKTEHLSIDRRDVIKRIHGSQNPLQYHLTQGSVGAKPSKRSQKLESRSLA
jgi:hypothetical protein